MFRFALGLGLVDGDPARDLQGVLRAKGQVNHRAALTGPNEVGGLMRALYSFTGTPEVKYMAIFSIYTFPRPQEVRYAEWTEIDFERSLWVLPPEKMKMKRKHIVPLSKQAVSVLKYIHPLTGDGKFIFPSLRSKALPISDNTINAALRRMGFSKEEQTHHGFRGTASTLLHEKGWDTEIIEMQLSHVDKNAVRSAYNHAKYLPQRIKMMQAWADYLDELKDS